MAWCAGALAQPGEASHVAPRDDGKDPSTLNQMLTPAPAAKDRLTTSASAARNETSFQGETNYHGRPLGAAKSGPKVLGVKSANLGQNVNGKFARSGYLVQPETEKPLGALLLGPEWWGLGPAIKGEADRLAGQGYKVLVIDLYGGQVAATRQEATRLMRTVQPDKALAAMSEALDPLLKTEDGRALKVGVIGWGSGGALALKLAEGDPRPAALVVYYSELPRDPGQVSSLACPILGFFSGRDAWVTPDKVRAFKTALKASKATIQTFSLDVLPGFALEPRNPTERGYAETARTQMDEFLTRNLQ
jgi:carboxymethylenebutenolidase